MKISIESPQKLTNEDLEMMIEIWNRKASVECCARVVTVVLFNIHELIHYTKKIQWGRPNSRGANAPPPP